ncbi:hypothetical protein B0H19DRAFT_1083352 [Mycena capillaripes]|nr:hypothetical protein B0H19DRAFT_1083352 [Mycena capillaripes]
MASLVEFSVDDSSPTISYAPFSDTYGPPDLFGGWNPHWQDPGFSSAITGSAGPAIASMSQLDPVLLYQLGTGIELFGNVTQAAYTITIDGKPTDTSSANLRNDTLILVENLEDGDHNLTLVVQMDTVPDGLFQFDRAVISALPSPPTKQLNLTQQILGLSFDGAWGAVNNNSRQSEQAGDKASTKFMGLDGETNHTLEIVNNEAILVLPIDAVNVWALEESPSPTAVKPGGPTQSASANPSRKLLENGTRTAVITVSVVFFLAVAILVSRLRKRRRIRAAQRTAIAEQFLGVQERVPQANNWRTKFIDTTNADNLPQTDPSSIQGPQLRGLEPDNGVAEDSPREETITVRMRRVEAQLENLLNMGLPEGSPPSYRE